MGRRGKIGRKEEEEARTLRQNNRRGWDREKGEQKKDGWERGSWTENVISSTRKEMDQQSLYPTGSTHIKHQ